MGLEIQNGTPTVFVQSETNCMINKAKFPNLRFSKRYSFNTFHQISTKRHTKYHNQGGNIGFTFWRPAKN